MADKYLDFVSGGFGKKLAKQLGLPSPVKLRRHTPGAPLAEGPVLVISDDDSRPAADELASALLPWHLDVRRSTHLPKTERWGAVIMVVTDAAHPEALAGPALELGSTLRQLTRSGRVITVSRAGLGLGVGLGGATVGAQGADASAEDAAGEDAPAGGGADTLPPAVAAVREGMEGFVRSVGKELRAGATANGIVLGEGVGMTSPAVLRTVRFLLSGKSAFVDGQLIAVDGDGTHDPDWERPLEGRVAVVTGAARGIGAAIVEVLARDGARVIGVDVPGAGDALAKVMNGVSGLALQLDVTAGDAAERILGAARERYGRLDIVVHNAGILRDKLLANMTEDRWTDLIAVNIAAPLAMNERFVEAAGAGELGDAPRIISLASTSGIAGNRGQSNYATAKAGVIGMTAALAAPLGQVGGTANAVAPGFIETEMTAKIPPVMRQVARRVNSLQQGGLPVDVAEAISFLASPAAGGINGQVLRVCGQHMVGR